MTDALLKRVRLSHYGHESSSGSVPRSAFRVQAGSISQLPSQNTSAILFPPSAMLPVMAAFSNLANVFQQHTNSKQLLAASYHAICYHYEKSNGLFRGKILKSCMVYRMLERKMVKSLHRSID